MADDLEPLKRDQAALVAHLPELDPLRQLDPEDESVEMFMALDIDLAAYETTDGSEQMLVVEGPREPASFMLYVPEWRRLYALANDGESVAIGDGDPNGEMAWAAVYRNGELVAALTEPQRGDDDSGLV